MQVAEGRQDLQDVGQRLVDGERIESSVVGPHPVFQDLLEGGPADVLHHDVASVFVGDEVVDLDDQRVLDLGEELLLHDGHGQRVFVAGIEQAFQYHPAIGHIVVFCEVDPAEPAMRQAAGHLVLVRHKIARLQLRREREWVAALRAKPFGPSRLSISRPTDRRPAVRAVPFLFGNLRVLHDRLSGIDHRCRRNPSEPSAESSRPEPLGPRTYPLGDLGTISGGSLRAEGRRLQPAGARCNRRHCAAGGHWRLIIGRLLVGRPPRAPANIAVAVDDRAGTAGLCAARAGGVGRRRPLCAALRRSSRGSADGPRAAADIAVAVDDGAGAARLGASCHSNAALFICFPTMWLDAPYAARGWFAGRSGRR